MRNLFITLLSFLAFVPCIHAYEVTATATDSLGAPLPYATYALFRASDANAVVKAVTDLDGRFSQQLDSAGTYRLEISYVGMATVERPFEVTDAAPVADLGTVRLAEASNVLADVTVTAQRPLVVKEIDRLGYDVAADPLRPTSSVSDVLRRVPMVSVDPDGTIKVNGSTDFKIYKDGRPNTSMSKNAKELFRALPASTVKRIEVITDPGADFDAEGTAAILNIVTDRTTTVKGVLGSVGTQMASDNPVPGVNTYVTTQISDFTLSFYTGYHHLQGRSYEGTSESESTFADGAVRRSVDDYNNKGDLGYFGLESSWQIDTLRLVNVSGDGYIYGFNTSNTAFTSTADVLGNIVNSLTARQPDGFLGYTDANFKIDYQRSTHRPQEFFTLSYLLSHTNQETSSTRLYTDVEGMSLPYTGIRSDFELDFYEHTLQADWARPFGGIHKINVGLKGIARYNNSTNNFDYEGLGAEALRFNHVTGIGAAYGQYAVQLGRVSLRAGLRYELARLKASYPDGDGKPFAATLSDPVPSAAASWQMSDASSLSFNYATSIRRPGISYLNPAVDLGPYSQSYGNPDLESAVRRSSKLTYSLMKPKFNGQFSASYDFTNNAITDVKTVGENNIKISTYGNSGRNAGLTLSTSMQWSPTATTTLIVNGSVSRREMESMQFSLSRWSQQGYLQVHQRLPWKLSARIYGSYYGSDLLDAYSYTEMPVVESIHYGLALQRNFLKADRLSVSVSLNNPFGPTYRKYTVRTVQGDYTGYTTHTVNRGFTAGLYVSYRFGDLQAAVKKAASTITNDDLDGRKK